ncbi:MAG: hypothetical protein RIT27_308 [Pseudomonadota bacterium]|jgi:general secretion pathway protein C
MKLQYFPLVVINMLLAAMLGYQATQLFLPPLPFLPSAFPQKQPNFQQLNTDISPLLRRRWFGQLTAPATPVQTAQLPETALNLTLQGTLFSDDPQQAKAIIADTNNKADTYRRGQTFQGVVLQDILPDRVLLQRNGTIEILRLKKETSNLLSTQVSPPVSSPTTNLSSFRREILDKPANLSKVVRIKPAEKNGKLLGYELNAGNDSQLFQQLGLQNGDIAIKINDIPLDVPTQSFNALQQLSTAKNLKLDVLRKGNLQTLSIDLN